MSMKTHEDYVKSWQQLLIMYRSRYEKRMAWKEKSEDFKKIEEALVEQQKELDDIEQKLPEPLKVKKKKEKKKPGVNRSKEAVVYVLDLENKTAEPFGNQPMEDENENEVEVEEKPLKEPEKLETESKPISSSPATTIINDPFFLNSQHQITYQKRTSRNQNDADVDDKTFIEHSYFVDALSSSSNRRDGRGEVAKKKWAHLSLPNRPRTSNKTPSKPTHNGK